ncbi:hemerythrin domain-containing protein [Faunimonas sp. B44]|uniref:hemerythrin domain-containing protein n=1 Tax=Faunimonas sp. B44 TaxID=3461493 RepID=UPI004044B82C
MTTIRQLIHSSPKKANELFAKLVDTSDGAVKTRDRLFSELKDELELHAALEEQHLFPVLKKHKESKDLATEAMKDNRQTRKLLTELESTPKDSEEFGTKVAELKKAFQQHVRDEKKELLPAVMKALSDEEASTVVENIEDEKAQVEASQRAEADERRAEAKREREDAKAKREREQAKAKREREQAEAADAAKSKAKSDADQKDTVAAETEANSVARKSDEENEQSKVARRPEAEREMAGAEGQAMDMLEAGAKVAQQGAKVTRMATRAGAEGASEMSKAIRATTGSEETQEAGRETYAASTMMALLNQQAEHAMQAAIAMGRARTVAEVAKAQGDFIGGSFQRMGQFNSRYVAFVRGEMPFMSFPSSRR